MYMEKVGLNTWNIHGKVNAHGKSKINIWNVHGGKKYDKYMKVYEMYMEKSSCPLGQNVCQSYLQTAHSYASTDTA